MGSTVARDSKGYIDCNGTKEVQSSCVTIEISPFLILARLTIEEKWMDGQPRVGTQLEVF